MALAFQSAPLMGDKGKVSCFMAKKQERKIKKPTLKGNQNAAKRNPRSEILTIRLTAGELEGVKRAAAMRGINYTRYARIAVLDASVRTIVS